MGAKSDKKEDKGRRGKFRVDWVGFMIDSDGWVKGCEGIINPMVNLGVGKRLTDWVHGVLECVPFLVVTKSGAGFYSAGGRRRLNLDILILLFKERNSRCCDLSYSFELKSGFDNNSKSIFLVVLFKYGNIITRRSGDIDPLQSPIHNPILTNGGGIRNGWPFVRNYASSCIALASFIGLDMVIDNLPLLAESKGNIDRLNSKNCKKYRVGGVPEIKAVREDIDEGSPLKRSMLL
ncbi:hypothetical protein Tco_1531224 [Tanacetum coccineum]